MSSSSAPILSESMSESDITKMLDSESLHKIKSQRQKRPRVSEDGDVGSLADFKSEIMGMIKSHFSKQSNRLDNIESYLKEVMDQNQGIRSSNTDIDRSIKSFHQDLKDLQTKISSMETERKEIYSNISVIQQKIERIEKRSLITSVELRNVPLKHRETKQDLFNYVQSLCNTLKCELQHSDIRDVYRIPSKRDINKDRSASSTMVIECNNTITKLQLLSGIQKFTRERKTNLSSSCLGFSGLTVQPIYGSELLTSKTKRLLFLAKDFAKTNDYRYCWTSNGNVYLRKRDGDQKYILVKNEEDLKKINATK